MIETLTLQLQDTPLTMDLRRLPGDHKHIALVPQWDFLELLATAAEQEPSFRLMRSTEVLGPVYERRVCVGVRYRGDDGERRMRAALTVACDGRSSTLRSGAGLMPRTFGAPIDVWWFRLSRADGDPRGLNGRFADGHGVAIIDRGDYYQIAYVIQKGPTRSCGPQGVASSRADRCPGAVVGGKGRRPDIAR